MIPGKSLKKTELNTNPQTSEMKSFATIATGLESSTIVAKLSITDV